MAATISSDTASRGSMARTPERKASTAQEFSVGSVKTTIAEVKRLASDSIASGIESSAGDSRSNSRTSGCKSSIRTNALPMEKLPTTLNVGATAKKDSSPSRTTWELAPIRIRIARPYLFLSVSMLATSWSSFTDGNFKLDGFASSDHRYGYRFTHKLWLKKSLQITKVAHSSVFKSDYHIPEQHTCFTAGPIPFYAHNDQA